MARTRKALPARVDVAHLIGAGVRASVCPRALIEEVLCDAGKARRLDPDRLSFTHAVRVIKR